MMEAAEVVEVKNSATPEKTRDAIFDELRNDLAEWMDAKEDTVWRPKVELTKEDNEFAARALVPGVDPKDIQVMIAPDVLLIKGCAHRCGSPDRKVFREVRFPQAVSPDSVRAEVNNGMLSVRARIAGQSKKFVPQAA